MADAMNRSYFLTYLLPSSLTETEVKEHQDSITSLVKKHKGTVTEVQEWGKKKLAYKLKHAGKWYTDAFYLHFVIEMDPSHINAFEKDIYLQTQIMRHLLVVATEANEKQNQAE